MKIQQTKRGLFVHTKRTAETDAEMLETLRESASALQPEAYVAEAKRLAAEILRDAGIDAATLFEKIEVPGGRSLRYATIDLAELAARAPAAADAIEVMQAAWLMSGDLANPGATNVMFRAFRLAERRAAMSANLHWEKPVRGYFASRRKSQLEARVYATADVLTSEGVRSRNLATRTTAALHLQGVEVSAGHVRELLNRR